MNKLRGLPSPGDVPEGEAPIPIHLLTGFLGSGKTTLLNRILRAPGMDGTLVIVNEFGEVGLDHLLIETPEDETILLANGCLCCAVSGDLLVTLSRLILRRDAGEMAPFGRVVIETTGLADPVPILRTLMADALVSSRFELQGVVTVVDGCNGVATIEAHPEAFKQAAVASRLVVSKTDLADAAQLDAVRERLRRINADAGLHSTALADAELAGLFADAGAGPAFGTALSGRAGVFTATETSHLTGPDTRVSTFVLTHDEPVSAEAFRLWLNALGRFRGPDLLRLKGLVNIEGEPVLIQAVQDVVHDPVTLDAWPSAERRTQLVFITQNIGRAEIEPTRAAFAFSKNDETAGRLPFGATDYARFVSAVRGFAPMERV